MSALASGAMGAFRGLVLVLALAGTAESLALSANPIRRVVTMLQNLDLTPLTFYFPFPFQ